jgi:hypothetical protein
LASAPAAADLTGFIGATTTPVNRPVKGLAVGVGMMIAFEFEYAVTKENSEDKAPFIRTGMANALIQPPIPIAGVQPYLIAGVGLYREELNLQEENGIAVNTGGGLKIRLAGPLRVRLDYRAFQFRGDAQHSPVHRIYAGLNLAF